MTKRSATLFRKTNETSVEASVVLDGVGKSEITTGVGFFDHMLEQISRHSLIDMVVKAEGDLHIDAHHTVEDIGIALGGVLREALGDKKGICRYGHFDLVMDEARASVALDFSGRPFLVWDVSFTADRLGDVDTELFREFFQALASNAGLTLHITQLAGFNNHHIAESVFKAFAKALRMAIEYDPRTLGQLPSTKGVL